MGGELREEAGGGLMIERVIFGVEDLVATCETLDEFRNSAELIKSFELNDDPFMVSRRTKTDVHFLDQQLEENSVPHDVYDATLHIGRDYRAKLSEYAGADEYVLELFQLDENRISFTVQAVASYLNAASEVNRG